MFFNFASRTAARAFANGRGSVVDLGKDDPRGRWAVQLNNCQIDAIRHAMATED